VRWWRAELANGGVVQWVSPRESRDGKILRKMEGVEMGGGGCPSWCCGGWLSLMRSVPVVGEDRGVACAEGERGRVVFGEKSNGWWVPVLLW
jgi:hypothetical protein